MHDFFCQKHNQYVLQEVCRFFFVVYVGHFIMNTWNFSAFVFVYERLFFPAPDIVYSGLNRCHTLMAC